jgi:steroid delta-isomerase-like uncharacterized protein
MTAVASSTNPTGSIDPTELTDLTEQEGNKRFIRWFVDAALNQGDLALADRHFAPDYQVHIPFRELPPGPAAFKGVMQTWRAAFADWHMTIQDLVAEGDRVVNRFVTTGTHTGPLFGHAATGRTFTIHGVTIHRIAAGLVRETWVSDDVPSMLQQLGLLAPVAPAAPAGPQP